MRKFFALLALVLGVVSCQTEPEGFDATVGGESEVNITVSLPEATRANSALGAFDNISLDDYSIQYFFQVFNEDGTQKKDIQEITTDDKTASFPVRLIPGRTYKFVVWAHLVDADGDAHYAINGSLENIVLNEGWENEGWKAMDESRDAYTCSKVCEFNGAGIELTLTRPFAKLRVITNDMKELMGVKPAYGKVTYTTKHRTSFNAFIGKAADASESKIHTYEIAEYELSGDSKVLFTDYFFAEDDVVKFDLEVYEDEAMTKLIKANNFNTDIPVKRNTLTTIAGNILTVGDDITVTIEDGFAGENKYLYDAISNAYDLQAAVNAASDGVNTIIRLAENVNFGATTRSSDAVDVLNIPEGKVITLDLNGKNIVTGVKEEGRHYYAIDNYGTLTIEGTGAINARGVQNFGTMTVDGNVTITNVDTNGGAAIWNEGTLTINGGTFKTNAEAEAGSYGAALNTRATGTAIVNGGVFEAYSQLTYAIINDGTTTINNATVKGKHGTVAGSAEATTTINGGTFSLMENPNVSDHCMYFVSDIRGGSFTLGNNTDCGAKVFYESTIAEGYAAINSNETYYVIKGTANEDGTVNALVANAAELKTISNLVDAGCDTSKLTVTLTDDIDLSAENWNPIGDNRTDAYFCGTFDGQNHTITGAHITGDHCFNGAVYGSKEGWGLFSVTDGATIKNLKVDGAIFGSYTVISGTIAAYANNTTFENIDITNSKVAGYNWYTGGVVGWAAGECTFKGVNLDETVAVGTLWDSHGQNAGGIAGGVSSSAKITIEDCNISCVMDVINDVTSSYKWCVYRVAGMIIGNTNTTETKYNEVVTASATNVTCKNVTVTYGKWMNYHYCEGFWNRGWGRYESSDYVGGVDEDEPHNHAEGEEHCVCFPFDQLFGGSSNGSGHYPVKGLAEFPGVTVVYPAEYTCELCGEQHNVK